MALSNYLCTESDSRPTLEVAVTVKKVLTWLFAAFVLFFLAFRPNGAANVVRGIGGLLGRIAGGLGDFLSNLAGGGR
jgi:hypothetical protein